MYSTVVRPMPRRGDVDHALGGNVVRRIHQQRQIRHDVADFGTVEESRAADDAVRHARAQQHVFDGTALRVGAVEDGDLVVRNALASLMLDFRGNPTAFIAFVGSHVNVDLVTLTRCREQLLFLAVRIVGHHGVRGGEDIARAAIVLLELHRVGAGVMDSNSRMLRMSAPRHE